jgi:hypothetical protein
MSLGIVALILAIPSAAALIAWFLWLGFCHKIVNKHGAQHLKTLPGIATCFKPRDWFTRLPNLNFPGRRRAPSPSEQDDPDST